MGVISEWLTNIILFILLATILELLLPNSNMQRYVKMVIGLLLLLLLLNPLLSIFNKDVNEWLSPISNDEFISEFQIENSIENKKIDIERGQRAYISEQVAVQLKRQVEEGLLHNFALKVTDINITLDNELTDLSDENEIVEHVWLKVEEVDEEVIEDQIDVESVPVVSINTNTPLPESVEKENTDEIQDFLAETWQIPKDSISLVWEGGES